MTSDRDVEMLLTEFYRDGPMALPPELHRVLLARLAVLPQRRGWVGLARGATAVRWAAIALVLTVAVGIGALQSGAHVWRSASPSGQVTGLTEKFEVRTAPPSWQLFRSNRYGYSVRHSAAFITAELPGTFLPGDVLNGQGTDQFNAPGVAQLAIGRLAVAANVTPADWRSQARLNQTDCRNPEASGSLTVDGAPGLVDLTHCASRYVQVAYVVVDGYGYEVFWTSAGGNEQADLETFLEVLGSLQIVR